MNGQSPAAAGSLEMPRAGTELVALARALSSVQPRIALRPEEAAAALGVSREFFDVHVKPELQLVRRGRLVLVPVAELERWVSVNAERTLPA